MKKKLLILSVLVICIATLAGGTIAYFTSEYKAHNVITTGGVEIKLLEWADEDKETPFKNLDGVMPGTEVTKIVEVKNTGSAPAWVRVSVDKSITLANGEQVRDTRFVEVNINDKAWTERDDGYYYYNAPLAKGETTEPLFTSVKFNAGMGNEYQNSTATVDVYAQAVQYANNGTTALTAAGWPDAAPTSTVEPAQTPTPEPTLDPPASSDEP